jgi:hypothetical protein
MSMTRRDFEVIARHLNSYLASCDSKFYDNDSFKWYTKGMTNIITVLAGACQEINPRFDNDKFIQAVTKGALNDD